MRCILFYGNAAVCSVIKSPVGLFEGYLNIVEQLLIIKYIKKLPKLDIYFPIYRVIKKSNRFGKHI